MSAPRVYSAISAITAELAETGIPKNHTNARDRYAYRSIDDVTACLAPLVARHKLCILPRVIDRTSTEHAGLGDALLTQVALKVAFDLVSARDGSSHTVEAYGEALDNSDKATSKAMSSAFKQMILQAFCVPSAGAEDAEAQSPRLIVQRDQPDPDQGWEQWALDIQDMINSCETGEAIDRVQATYRGLLRAASKRRPDLYAAIGLCMKARRGSVEAKAPGNLDMTAGNGKAISIGSAQRVEAPAHA